MQYTAGSIHSWKRLGITLFPLQMRLTKIKHTISRKENQNQTKQQMQKQTGEKKVDRKGKIEGGCCHKIARKDLLAKSIRSFNEGYCCLNSHSILDNIHI